MLLNRFRKQEGNKFHLAASEGGRADWAGDRRTAGGRPAGQEGGEVTEPQDPQCCLRREGRTVLWEAVFSSSSIRPRVPRGMD